MTKYFSVSNLNASKCEIDCRFESLKNDYLNALSSAKVTHESKKISTKVEK